MDVIPMHTALLSDIELFAGACPLRLQLFWLCSGSESVMESNRPQLLVVDLRKSCIIEVVNTSSLY